MSYRYLQGIYSLKKCFKYLFQLEMEIQKVHDSHTALIKSSQKREALWSAMKRKLEERISELEGQSDTGGK